MNLFKDKKKAAYREMRDLSECHLRKLERPGRARVKVNHLTTGLSVIGEGVDRHEAKYNAYADLCAKLGNPGAAARYADQANEARKKYAERLKREADMDFGDD